MTDAELFAVTTGGLPYPESTGPANQGANDIKALALALEARGHGRLVQAGKGSGTTGSNSQFSVTFPIAFGGVPFIVLCPDQGQPYNLSVAFVNATKFDVGAWWLPTSSWAPAGYSPPYQYIAIGPAAA